MVDSTDVGTGPPRLSATLASLTGVIIHLPKPIRPLNPCSFGDPGPTPSPPGTPPWPRRAYRPPRRSGRATAHGRAIGRGPCCGTCGAADWRGPPNVRLPIPIAGFGAQGQVTTAQCQNRTLLVLPKGGAVSRPDGSGAWASDARQRALGPALNQSIVPPAFSMLATLIKACCLFQTRMAGTKRFPTVGWCSRTL
jgi:hypothetical protein